MDMKYTCKSGWWYQPDSAPGMHNKSSSWCNPGKVQELSPPPLARGPGSRSPAARSPGSMDQGPGSHAEPAGSLFRNVATKRLHRMESAYDVGLPSSFGSFLRKRFAASRAEEVRGITCADELNCNFIEVAHSILSHDRFPPPHPHSHRH